MNFEDQLYRYIFINLYLQWNYSNLDIVHTQCSYYFVKVWLALKRAVLCLLATAGRSSLQVSICSWALVANTHTSRDERRRWRFLFCCIHRNSSRYVTNRGRAGPNCLRSFLFALFITELCDLGKKDTCL